MGCPVKKVTKNGAGSALLCDPPRAAAIVRAIREATGLPVTAKIRSGWDAQRRNYVEMAAALEEAGCVGARGPPADPRAGLLRAGGLVGHRRSQRARPRP